MFGFNAGLVMLGVMVAIPVIYLLSYGLNSFNKWRLGESMPQHKIKINIILALVIGFIMLIAVCRPADLKESVC